MDLLEAATCMALMVGHVLAVITASSEGASELARAMRHMIMHKMFRPALAVIAGLALGAPRPAHAGDAPGGVFGEAVTVLTMARGGAWGTATEISTSRAIALAIRNCQAMSQGPLGCGAMYTTVRSGWSVALLCGDEPIIAASAERAEAERRTLERETELREVYRRDMPPCLRVATVDPNGVVVTPPLYTSGC